MWAPAQITPFSVENECCRETKILLKFAVIDCLCQVCYAQAKNIQNNWQPFLFLFFSSSIVDVPCRHRSHCYCAYDSNWSFSLSSASIPFGLTWEFINHITMNILCINMKDTWKFNSYLVVLDACFFSLHCTSFHAPFSLYILTLCLNLLYADQFWMWARADKAEKRRWRSLT